jgi:hypothetical protein
MNTKELRLAQMDALLQNAASLPQWQRLPRAAEVLQRGAERTRASRALIAERLRAAAFVSAAGTAGPTMPGMPDCNADPTHQEIAPS